ncbi:MAG TPA: mannosyltransferase family protein [Candidatus Limnocylindrales bacterium]
MAAESWPGGYVSDRSLPPSLGGGVGAGIGPGFGAGVEQTVSGVATRVRGAALVVPLVIAIASRLYSALLLSIVPLLQPNLAVPHLTGFRSPFLQWDSQWYMTIATWGYHAEAMQAGPFGGRHDFAFFPAWPTLLRGFEVLGFQVADIAAPLANLLFVAAAVFIFVVLERQFGRTTATWGTALLAFSPPAYVLSMAYSEPLYLLLVGALFATRSGVVRGLLGAAVGVTRLTGVAVAAAAGVRWLRNWRDWAALATAVGVGLAFAGWWAFIWVLTGDPLGWFQGSAQWGHKLGFAGIAAAITEPTMIKTGYLAFVALMLGASILLLRRNLELGLYAVLAIGLSLIGAPVESMPRHAMVAFPAFGLIADRLGPKRSAFLLIAFAAIQANYVILAFVGPQPFAP